MKQLRLWLGLTLCVCCISGCWDYRELDKDAPVQAIAFDRKSNGSYLISAQISNFTESSNENGGNSSIEVVDSHAQHVSEAISNLSLMVPSHISLTHYIASIYGEKMLKSRGFGDSIDRITRRDDIRRRSLMFATAGDARKLLTMKLPLSPILGTGLARLAEQSNEQQFSFKMDLNELLVESAMPGMDPWLPRLIIVKDSMNQHLELNGSAALQGKYLAGWLNGQETRGILWAKGKPGESVFTIRWKGDMLTVRTRQMQSKITPVKSKRHPTFLTLIRWKGNITMLRKNRSIRSSTDLPSIEKDVSQYIEDTVLKGVHKCQEEQSDVVGYGNSLYRQNPRRFESSYQNKWDSKGFPRAHIIVRIESTIDGTGLTTTTPQDER